MAGLTRLKFGGSAVAVVVAMIVAGCGGSSSSTAAKSAAGPSPYGGGAASSASASAAPSGVSVSTASGSQGKYLVGPSGRALYLWAADTGNQSSCSGSCAKVWPPLLSTGTPVALGGAAAGDLGTVARADGTKQVTYKGHPLYYFVADHGPGTTKGQGSDSFGAKWWLLAPSGSAITATGSSTVASSGGSGYSSSSGGGGSSSGGGSGWG